MSIFKSKGIVLRKTSSQQNTDIIYTIFSYDYGKIQASSKINKKEKTLDLGNIIDFEIETSKASAKINKIKNIKISSIFLYEDKEYKIIEQYLKIINSVLKLAPEGVQIASIFETIKHINKEINIDYTKLILAELKILNILGILKLEDRDITITKILNFISKNNLDKIFLLTGIDDIILNKLINKTKI